MNQLDCSSVEKDSSSYDVKVIFFEAGCGGGSVNRLVQLLKRWDYGALPVGVVCFYRIKKASEALSFKDPVFAISFGLAGDLLPDPVTRFSRVVLPTSFGLRYLFSSLMLLRKHKGAVVYINNTPYPHLPLIFVAGLMKRKIICHLRDTVKLSKLEMFASRFISNFVALSCAARDYYCEQGIDAKKINVVYDSIIVDEQLKEFPGRDSKGGVTTVIVGSLVERKGQDIAIRAFRKVRNLRPSALLVLAGDGSARSSYEDLVQTLDLEDCVKFLGHLTDVDPVLKQADIGMLTSRREGMPNSVMEYMAYHLPVVVSDLPGIEELIEDGVSGYIIRDGNEDDLVRKWVHLIDCSETRFLMGKKGFTTILQGDFTPERELAGITSVIMET